MDSTHSSNITDLSKILIKHSKRGNGSYYEIGDGDTKTKILQSTITRVSNNLQSRVAEHCEPTNLEDYLFDYFPPPFRKALEKTGVSRSEAYGFMASQPPPVRQKRSTPAMELAVIIAKGIPRRVKIDGKESIRSGAEQVEVLIKLINERIEEVENLLDEWAQPNKHGINARGYINVQEPKLVKKPRG